MVVTALIVIGVVAWRVWDAAGSNEITTPSNNQSGSATYLDVKELGIKLKLSDDIKDLTYQAFDLSDGSKGARFSTGSLAAIDQNCGADFGPLGSLEATTVDTDRTGAKKVVDNSSIFKIGAYYVTYSGPQALCSDKASTVLGKAQPAFRESLKTLQVDK